MAAKKVNVLMGFVPIATKWDVAVDDDSNAKKDIHTVCTGPDDSKHDPIRVKQSTSCPTCKISHSWSGAFPEKGTEREGKMVVLTKEEVDGASGTPITGKEIPVQLGFKPREQVYGSTLPSKGVHNITPDKGGEKTYALLRDALAARPGVVAVGTWAPSSKNALWVIEVVEDRLVASKRCYPEDVRQKPVIAPVEYTETEAAQFGMMVDTLVEDFDLIEYADKSRAKLTELIASKTGEAVTVGAAPVAGAPTGDLLAAIQATIDAKKKPAPTAVKTAAKKPAAKKVAAKKTATRRQKESAA